MIDYENLDHLFKKEKFEVVCNLAAQAGSKTGSIEKPKAYIDSNIVGFSNILECCRHNKINIYYLQVVQVFTVKIKKFLFLLQIMLIIQLVYTLPQKKVMN